MEYLDDGMDDLFRKAGEHYPLRTSDSDWDGVLGRLQSQAGREAVPAEESGKKRNNKNSRFLWLLLLLPLGLFSLKYFSGSERNNPIKSTEPGVAKLFGDSGRNQILNKPLAAPDNVSLHRKTLPASSGNLVSNQTLPGRKNHRHVYPNNSIQQSSPVVVADKTTAPAALESTMRASAESASSDSTASSNTDSLAKTVKDNDAAARKDSIAKNGVVQASINSKDVNSNQKNKKTKTHFPLKEKGIYISLVAGPDFSTIKFQSVKHAGYSMGILLGYRFSKNISAEAGLLWDKKQYYSDGEYFNKSRTGLPNSADITDLNGICNMFEIPVSFRYDFSFSSKGRFFSTAGLSTYIMKKENYVYNADYNGSAWSRKVSYANSGNNLFSILQFSAGYEYNWGKIGRIRIEPYVKVPLAGVGIGSLPISSAGIQIGITHPFR